MKIKDFQKVLYQLRGGATATAANRGNTILCGKERKKQFVCFLCKAVFLHMQIMPIFKQIFKAILSFTKFKEVKVILEKTWRLNWKSYNKLSSLHSYPDILPVQEVVFFKLWIWFNIHNLTYLRGLKDYLALNLFIAIPICVCSFEIKPISLQANYLIG